MSNARTKLSKNQLERGRILIFVKGFAWERAAAMVGAKYEAFRRALDPPYRLRRNALTRDRLNALRPPPVEPVAPPRGKRKLAAAIKSNGQQKDHAQPLDLTDAERERKRAVAGNEGFIRAMRAAIASRRESPSIGTVQSPGTDHPQRVRIPTIGSMPSPAGMCADS